MRPLGFTPSARGGGAWYTLPPSSSQSSLVEPSSELAPPPSSSEEKNSPERDELWRKLRRAHRGALSPCFCRVGASRFRRCTGVVVAAAMAAFRDVPSPAAL